MKEDFFMIVPQQLSSITNKWIMKQSWKNLLFAHWPVPVESLRPFVPEQLEIDTFERYAWLGIVVFVMDGIYLRGLPRLPLFAKFPEINVRTYVRYGGQSGVYFLSLDAPHWVTYTVAKKWYRLPYYYSQIMSFQDHLGGYYYNSLRNDRNSAFSVQFNGNFMASPGVYFAGKETFEYWLTERYRLFSVDARQQIYSAEIDHHPWPLQKAEAEIQQNTMTHPFNIQLPQTQPILLYSEGVNSIISNIKRMGE